VGESPEVYQGNTPEGIPVLFACIENEPTFQDQKWQLGGIYLKLL
jgi:hypothetical protein